MRRRRRRRGDGVGEGGEGICWKVSIFDLDILHRNLYHPCLLLLLHLFFSSSPPLFLLLILLMLLLLLLHLLLLLLHINNKHRWSQTKWVFVFFFFLYLFFVLLYSSFLGMMYLRNKGAVTRKDELNFKNETFFLYIFILTLNRNTLIIRNSSNFTPICKVFKVHLL